MNGDAWTQSHGRIWIQQTQVIIATTGVSKYHRSIPRQRLAASGIDHSVPSIGRVADQQTPIEDETVG